MRILLLCDRYPFPLQNGQNLRIYNYVQELRQRHRFDLVCYADQPKAPTELAPLFETITAFAPPVRQRCENHLRLLKAFSVDDMFAASSETKAFLVRLLKEHTYDLIWVSGWDMIVNLPKRPDVPLLADAVDDGVLEYWREVRAARTLYQFLRMLKWLLMNYLFERRYFGPADRCLFVSEVDAAFFNRVCRSTRVSAVHNGVDVDYYRPCETARRPFNMVFEGNMSFRPNTDGILYFCRAVLPLIRAHIPEASLTLVGKNPTAEILSLRTEGIEVTGFVEDVRPYLDRAGVFICPLRIGAGIKNKILQAWAMAKPVVATPASVGGLLWREGENILVRNSASEFADATVEILRSPKRSEAIGNAARATILNHYTWDKKARELETIMLEISGDQLGHHSGAMSYNNTSR